MGELNVVSIVLHLICVEKFQMHSAFLSLHYFPICHNNEKPQEVLRLFVVFGYKKLTDSIRNLSIYHGCGRRT